MIEIVKAKPEEFAVIKDIAYKTWPDTYGAILSKQQLDYMLDLFYSEKALQQNASEKGHQFFLAKEHGLPLAFVAIEHDYQQKNATRIHKIYILPETQGKGIGKLLIEKAEALAVDAKSERLSLNVNRHNAAQFFYKKLGFEIVGEEDIAIGNGYLMEDYIMEKLLR